LSLAAFDAKRTFSTLLPPPHTSHMSYSVEGKRNFTNI
jgi:hypothetical protein